MAGGDPTQVGTWQSTTHAAFAPRDELRSEEERAFYRWFDAHWDGTMGYAGAGNARHDTIAASLADSPAGLAAWMSRSSAIGATATATWGSRFDKDALLTTVTLYWLTDTFVSSYRPHQSGIVAPAAPVIDVPATVSVEFRSKGR